jgi:hypothetical protein
MLSAKIALDKASGNDVRVTCTLGAGGTVWDSVIVGAGSASPAVAVLQFTATLESDATVEVSCIAANTGITAQNRSLHALKITTP